MYKWHTVERSVPKNFDIWSLSKFKKKYQILSKFFTRLAGPVNKKLTGSRQYLLASGEY